MERRRKRREEKGKRGEGREMRERRGKGRGMQGKEKVRESGERTPG